MHPGRGWFAGVFLQDISVPYHDVYRHCCFDRILKQTASTSFGGKSNNDRLRVGKGVEWLV